MTWIWLGASGGILIVAAGLIQMGVARAPRGSRLAVSQRAIAPILAVIGVAALVSAFAALPTPADETGAGDARPGIVTPAPPTQYKQDAEAGQAPPAATGIEGDNSYRLAVVEVNNEIARQLGALTDLLVVPEYDDEAWLDQVGSVLTSMEMASGAARVLKAPDKYAKYHAAWLEGIDSYEWAAQNMRQAIRTQDYALMRACTDRLARASSDFREATGLLQQVDTE